ncbi:MAG: undecaprenyl-diphosphate phosphatase [Patescibacteria group bacterium]
MTILHSIFFGIIEGITEFLPISSTGHLILASRVLHVPETSFTTSFDIIIQLGAILAVVVLYWKQLWKLETIKKLIVGFVPTGIIGLLLYKIAKTYLLSSAGLVAWVLLIGGIVLIAFEYWYARKNEADATETISYKQAFLIGIFQSLAIVPGLSRSAATIIGGLSLGIKRETIVEFSFLLAVPTMLAATVLDIYKNASSFSADQVGVLSIGFLTAFAVALCSIVLLLRYIRKHNFVPFGIYRIAIAVVFLLFIL